MRRGNHQEAAASGTPREGRGEDPEEMLGELSCATVAIGVETNLTDRGSKLLEVRYHLGGRLVAREELVLNILLRDLLEKKVRRVDALWMRQTEVIVQLIVPYFKLDELLPPNKRKK